MLIDLKVKTLDAQTHDFQVDNEMTIREFKDKIAERTNIAAEQQRIIFCGRVLADEKKIKEFDVQGKVVHVAERPPPAQRSNSATSDRSERNERPGSNNTRSQPRRMRDSPLFRALDGMVVGTMAIPVNGSQATQMPLHAFPSSSTFCVNRITVARHMLNCANNIAAYLENPDRGLNNASLDILARGRWTMESTVVEVGITAADLPQNDNIVEMVQDALSAALRQNGNSNVTVFQLPTVFGPNESGVNTVQTSTVSMANNSASTAASDDDRGSVLFEDLMESEDNNAITNSLDVDTSNVTRTEESPRPTEPAPHTSSTDAETGEERNENSATRRTGTVVLADVIDQMCTVQARLNPFMEQYYDILRNEPVFADDDIAGRESTQRLFDRVSEAFHYLSHAQHAISDLMLDLGLPTPRYLTCRPILVEQSGYVSSNNYLSAAAAAAAAAAALRGTPNQRRPPARPYTLRYTPTDLMSRSRQRSENNRNSTTVEDPVDEPINPSVFINNTHINTNANTNIAPQNAATQNIDTHQMQVARLIQAVVNSAPSDSEFHVQINAPGIMSFGIPMGATGPRVNNTPEQSPRTANLNATNNGNNGNNSNNTASNSTSVAASNSSASNGAATTTTAAAATTISTSTTATITNSSTNSSSSSTTTTAINNTTSNTNTNTEATPANRNIGSIEIANNQARVTTATLPTTSTQTRSTSRPQMQIGNVPANNWNARYMPTNFLSAFDRFLPCNSHHIREPEGNGAAGATATTNPIPVPNAATNTNQRTTTATSLPRNTSPTLFPYNLTASSLSHNGMSNISFPIHSTSSSPLRNTFSTPLSRNATPTLQLPRWARFGRNSPQIPQNIRDLFSNIPTNTGGQRSGPDANNVTLTRNSGFLRRQMVHFLNETIFDHEPINDTTIPQAIDRAVRWFDDSLLAYIPQYEKPQYDSRDSVFNLLRRMMPLFIDLLNNNRQNDAIEFIGHFKRLCEQFIKRLYSVIYVCVGHGNAEILWAQMMRLLLIEVRTVFRSEALDFLLTYVNTTIPMHMDTDDAEQFIVYRGLSQTETTGLNTDTEEFNEFSLPPDTFALDDDEMGEVASTSTSGDKQDDKKDSMDVVEKSTDGGGDGEGTPEELLPSVTNGSEPWHNNFPTEWLPVITRDVQTQAEDPPTQPPYSDVYINGMSVKRRKLVQNSKPPADVSGMVADSVEMAIRSVGVSTSTAANQSQTAEEITNAIATDAAVQTSYTESLRNNVRERLKQDPDYNSDKFPQTTKFLNK